MLRLLSANAYRHVGDYGWHANDRWWGLATFVTLGLSKNDWSAVRAPFFDNRTVSARVKRSYGGAHEVTVGFKIANSKFISPVMQRKEGIFMKIVQECDLTAYNTYRIVSVARKAYFPETVEEVRSLFVEGDLRKKVILGGGSNVIFSYSRYDDIDFIVLRDNFSRLSLDGQLMTAQAGTLLSEMIERGYESGLGGMETYFDIPGTIGGAVVMNAGMNEDEISCHLEQVTWLERSTGAIVSKPAKDLVWGYRYSEFQKRERIVLEAVVRLQAGDVPMFRKKRDDIVAKRHAGQPWEQPNAGSVFKRPQGRFVGQMLEELGLKGTNIGGMEISKKHAGFIVNTGGGTGADVLRLIELVTVTVREKYGISLEAEQIVI